MIDILQQDCRRRADLTYEFVVVGLNINMLIYALVSDVSFICCPSKIYGRVVLVLPHFVISRHQTCNLSMNQKTIPPL